MKKLILGSLSAAVLSTTLHVGAQQLEAEKQIEYRQAGYQFMAWNMGKIKAQVIDNSVAFNADQMKAAANAIAAIANSGMGALYGPDTAMDKMGDETHLKASFFDNLEEAGQLAGNFTKAANHLASEAQSGDKDKIRTAFGLLGKTCKACHQQFRARH